MTKAPSSILLFEEAQKRGYEPVWKTDYGFFTFSHSGKTIYVYQTKNFANSQMGTWLALDKNATRIVLGENGLPNIPYYYAKDKKALDSFFDTHHPLIAKPVLGEMAKDVVLVEKKQDSSQFNLEEIIFEKYVEGDEYRVLLIHGEVVAMQKKEPRPTKDHPWSKKRINLTEGEWDKKKVELSKKIHTFIPQGLLAVDFIEDREGKLWILELNSMPGLWSFANPHEGEQINLAPRVLDFIIESQSIPFLQRS